MIKSLPCSNIFNIFFVFRIQLKRLNLNWRSQYFPTAIYIPNHLSHHIHTLNFPLPTYSRILLALLNRAPYIKLSLGSFRRLIAPCLYFPYHHLFLIRYTVVNIKYMYRLVFCVLIISYYCHTKACPELNFPSHPTPFPRLSCLIPSWNLRVTSSFESSVAWSILVNLSCHQFLTILLQKIPQICWPLDFKPIL